MKDLHDRNIDYLRISLTDRCNLRCIYCMPEEGVKSIPHCEILRLHEIEEVVKIAATLGIKNVRLTGGEPLVRKGIVDLVKNLRQIEGIEHIAMTTNATLLKNFARPLKDAGLDRVNISLDSLDKDQYAKITRRGNLDDALKGIECALNVGLDPVKINVVVVKCLQQDLFAFAQMTKDRPLHVRFIEYMPVGDAENYAGCEWGSDEIIPSEEVIAEINEQAEKLEHAKLQRLGVASVEGWGPAVYYKFPNSQGSIGTISALSNHFCSKCNRIRLTSDGRIKPCLFSDLEWDIKTPLRAGREEQVCATIREALLHKPEAHDFKIGTKRKMSQIGG